ncbi:hypothetical protein D3C72_2542160 [compost metagenome]
MQLAGAIDSRHHRLELQRRRAPGGQRQMLDRAALMLNTARQAQGHLDRDLMRVVIDDAAAHIHRVLA